MSKWFLLLSIVSALIFPICSYVQNAFERTYGGAGYEQGNYGAQTSTEATLSPGTAQAR